MKHWLIIFFLMISTTGCVGLTYIQGTENQILSIKDHKRNTSIKIDELTKSDLLNLKGEPDEKTDNLWVYYSSDNQLFGIVPAVILPLPLYFPTGKEKKVFEFTDKVATRATHYTSVFYGGYCGFVLDDKVHIGFKFGCINAGDTNL